MKTIKVLSIFIGAFVLLLAFLFCYDGHIFHFSLPAQSYYKASDDLPVGVPLELFKNAYGGCLEGAFAGLDGKVVRMKFSYASVYDGKSGRIYYKFHNYGEGPLWIKSKTLRHLTGKLWRMFPGSTFYFTFAGPPALEEETARLDLLHEEKFLGITFRFSAFGTSMDLLVPHEHKF